MSRYESNRTASDAALSANIRREILKIAVDYENDVRALMRGPKSGRVYGRSKQVKAYARYRAGQRKSRPSGVHQASAPGEAPAIDMAMLMKGIGHRIRRISRLQWEVAIGVTIESGRGGPQGSTGRSIADDLEFGTSKMAPRPMWRPALVRMRERLAARMGK